MLLTPVQCRMVRVGLDWIRQDLARRSGVAPTMIAEFEKGILQSYTRTIRDLRITQEAAGKALVDDMVSIEKNIEYGQ